MIKKIYILFLFFTLCLPVNAQGFCNVKFLSNHDGDTINFDLGANLPEIFRYMPLRLYGIDTPEIRTKNTHEKAKGVLARDFVKRELTTAKRIDLINCNSDKYFRILCRVDYDGKDLTNELLKRGYGYEYFGGTKRKFLNGQSSIAPGM